MSCSNNMHQIGIALQTFNNNNSRFPGSGQLDVSGSTSSGGSHTVGGWSFLVMILPYIEFKSTYDTLQINGGDPTTGTFSGSATPSYSVAASGATAMSIPCYNCPSNPNSPYQDAKIDNPPQYAVTNYKGMGATHIGSLNCVTSSSPSPGPAYPTGSSSSTNSMHPDGAMYPGTGCRIQDLTDGTAHTILCVETIDNTSSVWTYGTDVTLVGLPTSGGSTTPSGTVTFSNKVNGNPVAYYAPDGFMGSWDDAGKANGVQSQYQQMPDVLGLRL